MRIFIILYWSSLVAQIVIRAPYSRNQQKDAKSQQRVSVLEKTLIGLLSVGGFLFPLIYSLTHWLDFANYNLPGWAGWLGVVLLIISLFVFWRAHADLGANWSPSLEIRKEHTLITNGIYGSIRHPMYASQWIYVIALPFLLQNWIAGFAYLLIFIPFYFLRVGPEEKMMLDAFGDQYREYIKGTGALLPKKL